MITEIFKFIFPLYFVLCIFSLLMFFHSRLCSFIPAFVLPLSFFFFFFQQIFLKNDLFGYARSQLRHAGSSIAAHRACGI